ncbi:Fis family transcriptional regulator [Leucobacter sp. Psy1]|uniref:PucR family transcriptional regulator n=1 Tax=Leucobacter sp. Psy1 TaxID=2875729 RepID=UPI001CD7CB87|nr:PucR family transcriptional regulator [Leucobacter sp. Psy1]UBH06259.1 Fis family transcriptional regulator [Leucobacter sp. Psy1]
MEPTYTTIELGALVHQYQLGLVLIAGVQADTDERPVQWVHVSELEDPALFLPPRTVLLTTGARLSQHADQETADAFVQRLIDADATALGIAVGLHWDRIPQTFVRACDRTGFPLFRVPYDTAFISIVQTAARLLDAKAHERDAWALESQRGIARAALHRDGIGAAVREAAARLGRWVAITDRTGRVIEYAPRSERDAATAEWVRREARLLVERGVRAGLARGRGEQGVQMQTLGHAGQLHGVLVTQGEHAPDHADQTVIGLVAALATVQLEHRAATVTAEASLRRSILELLLEGRRDLAERVAETLMPRLPRGEVRAVVVAGGARDPEFEEDVASLAATSQGVLLAERGDAAVLVCEQARLPDLRRLVRAHELTAGASERGPSDRLPALLEQAERAVARPSAGGEVTIYSPALHRGLMHLLEEQPEARHQAETLLAPLADHDERQGDVIESTLATWLRHHGQTSAAAQELGAHRHTVKSRVTTAASLVQRDLDDPDARAELWAALRLLGRDALPAGSAAGHTPGSEIR